MPVALPVSWVGVLCAVLLSVSRLLLLMMLMVIFVRLKVLGRRGWKVVCLLQLNSKQQHVFDIDHAAETQTEYGCIIESGLTT